MSRKFGGKHSHGTTRGGCLLFCILMTAVALLVWFCFMLEAIAVRNTRSSTANDIGASTAASGLRGPNVASSIVIQSPKSKYAYVTLLSGIDESFRYRGFLYNVLIMRRALLQKGSTADFIVLVGYSSNNTTPFTSDMNLLRNAGIIIYPVPRFIDDSHKLGFAEMALLKITPYSFVQYSRVQFFDGDVMPIENMDCYFDLEPNSFTIGAVSPLNSGWYLAIPSQTAYDYMKTKAIWRLGRDWDKVNGWKEPMPKGLFYRGGEEECTEWKFNGADMDQGLFLHYFVINHGNALLIDTTTTKTRLFKQGVLQQKDIALPASESLSCCHGKVPTAAFAHFTGQSKPWMLDADAIANARKGSFLDVWKHHLDSLNLPNINSTNIASLGYGSPLGFWNAGFPKGGFAAKKIAGKS